jgi:hypothetical protein
MNTDADLIQRLNRSNLYNEFRQAFSVSTGVPLTLRPLDFWQLAHRSQPYENHFLFGSEAEKIVEHAPCPALVVR